MRIRRPLGLSKNIPQRLPERWWDPTKTPRAQILMSMSPDVFLVGAAGVPLPQLTGVPFPQSKAKSDELAQSVKSSWTNYIGLIIRKSEV
jgi:hypothetical protein